ncbi:tail fiber protein [Pseudomonas silvicola]|nr:tail fiber protein [Pseudomonas silvicola]
MDGFIGEVRAFAFGFEPQGWILCDGRALAISQYSVLYSVLGIAFGGDGTSNFQIPNLQAYAVLGTGTGPGLTSRTLGSQYGSAGVALSVAQLPAHVHTLTLQLAKLATVAEATLATPAAGTSWLGRPLVLNGNAGSVMPAYLTGQHFNTTLHPQAIAYAGGVNNQVQAHENRQPFLTMGYYVCLEGVYPSPA